MNTTNIINVVIDISRLYACYSERFVDILITKLDGWENLIDLAIITYQGSVRDLADCIKFVKDHYESADINEREYRLIHDLGTFIIYQINIPINQVVYADCELRHNQEWYTANLYIGFN